MTAILQVQTTYPTHDAAATLATLLLEKKLAACIQIVGPMTSYYMWQKTRSCSQEWLCLIKTTQAHYAAVEHTIQEHHDYDCPPNHRHPD